MNTIFLQCDQAGAEALIVAYLCKPGNKLRELFNHGIKPHTYVAMHLFASHWQSLGFRDLPLDWQISAIPSYPQWKDLSKAIKESDNDIPSKRFYYMAKQTVHSANYNIKGPTFIMNVLDKSDGEVVISLAEGNRFLNVYHDLFPEIRLWHGEINETIRIRKRLVNLQGFPRLFFGFVTDPDVQRDAYSWIPQSTVGCITHDAGIELQALLDSGARSDFAVLQNGHDSLLVECEYATKEEVKQLMLKAMKKKLVTERGEEFTMGAEIGEGYNWRDIK